MSAVINIVQSALDSPAFRFFFAAWTGLYLAQLLFDKERGKGVGDLAVIGMVFFLSVLIIKPADITVSV